MNEEKLTFSTSWNSDNIKKSIKVAAHTISPSLLGGDERKRGSFSSCSASSPDKQTNNKKFGPLHNQFSSTKRCDSLTRNVIKRRKGERSTSTANGKILNPFPFNESIPAFPIFCFGPTLHFPFSILVHLVLITSYLKMMLHGTIRNDDF